MVQRGKTTNGKSTDIFENREGTKNLEKAGRFLVNKGVVLVKEGRNEDAMAVFDDVVSRLGYREEIVLLEWVAKALVNKSVVLGKEDRNKDAITVCDNVVFRFGNHQEDVLIEPVARALIYKGALLGKEGRNHEETAVYDDLVFRFGDRKEGVLLEWVAKALLNKGALLEKAGRNKDAMAVYDDVVFRFGKHEEDVLLEQVAKALVNKGIVLVKKGRDKDAITIYDDVVFRFGDRDEDVLIEQVAKALVNKGALLGRQNQNKDAMAVYDDVVSRLDGREELVLLEWVAQTLVNKGVVLENAGRNKDAMAVYNDVLSRFGSREEFVLLEWVAKALVNKGALLGRQDRNKDAMAVYDDLISRFGDREELVLTERVTMALADKVVLQNKMGDAEETIKSTIRQIEDKIKKLESQNANTSKLHRWLFTFRNKFDLDQVDEAEKEKTKDKALNAIQDNLPASLSIYLTDALRDINKQKQDEYFERLKQSGKRTERFLNAESHFLPRSNFLMVLRECNSFLPVIPVTENSDRSGGYYLRYNNQGIVIDPGYDFIENFSCVGGVLRDINHIIVTDAHDDHAAELEALLMLVYQYNTNKKDSDIKQINLYLSTGTQRKFSGIIDLKNPAFAGVHTLDKPEKDFEHRYRITDGATLTVLPTYHDDVLAPDMCVGLGFEFKVGDKIRRIVFTGDSGLYPQKPNKLGKPEDYDNDKAGPILNTDTTKALYQQYPEPFINSPDLFIVHMGPIKEQEFHSPEYLKECDKQEWYYPNHLGLLGTLTMLHKIRPVAAVISEVGAELRGFYIELVNKIAQALHDSQKRDSVNIQKTFVIPGALTTLYSIDEGKFLCHQTLNFENHDKLQFKAADSWLPEWEDSTKQFTLKQVDAESVYLFIPDETIDETIINHHAKEFCLAYYNKKLPIYTV